jgi:hypothetical protein
LADPIEAKGPTEKGRGKAGLLKVFADISGIATKKYIYRDFLSRFNCNFAKFFILHVSYHFPRSCDPFT